MIDSQTNEIEINKFVSKTINSLKFFLQKNLFYIIFITIIGVVLAYLFIPYSTSYKSKVIISPNYGSVDYLYDEIELINSKINEVDLKFLEKNGISSSISKIEIKPINNIYQFVEENESNFNLLKLFAEDGDINKVSIDEKTSKNYKTHEITINSAKNLLNTHDINKLFNYLNNNKYYNDLRLLSIKNDRDRLLANKNTINLIDQVFSKSNNSNLSTDTKNLVYVNDNNQLNDLLKTKQDLIEDNEKIIKNELLSTDIIKQISKSLNVKSDSESNLKFYLILFPTTLLAIFFILRFIFKK